MKNAQEYKGFKFSLLADGKTMIRSPKGHRWKASEGADPKVQIDAFIRDFGESDKNFVPALVK